MTKRISLSLIVATIVLASAAPIHAEDRPVWEIKLQEQLLTEEQCVLNYMTNLQVQELGVAKSVEARAHCMDGRAFDVNSIPQSTKFRIRACGVSVC